MRNIAVLLAAASLLMPPPWPANAADRPQLRLAVFQSSAPSTTARDDARDLSLYGVAGAQYAAYRGSNEAAEFSDQTLAAQMTFGMVERGDSYMLFAAEASVTFNGRFEGQHASPSGLVDGAVDAHAVAVSGMVVGNLPGWQPFVRVGVAQTDGTLRDPTTGQVLATGARRARNARYWGIGIDVPLSTRFGARAEYTDYNPDDARYEALGAGLLLRF